MSAPLLLRTQDDGRLATTGIFLANGFGIGAWAVCIPWLKAEMGLSAGLLSLVLLAFAAGAVVSMPLAGLLAPRLGTSHATRLAALAFAWTLLLPMLAGNVVSLAAAAFAVGAGNGALDVSMNAHASSIERRRGIPIMSSFHAAFSAGGLLGAALGAVLTAGNWGGTAVLWGSALVIAIVTALIWTRLGEGEVSEGTSGLLVPSGGVLPLCAAALLCMLCEGAMTDWSAVYLSAATDACPAVAAAGYAVFSAAMLLGRLAGDRVVRALSRAGVVRVGGGLAAAGLGLAALASEPWLGIFGFGLVGLGLSNVVPAVFSAAGAIGRPPAAGIAMAATAGYAGFLVGPPLIGTIATITGFRGSMVVLSVTALLIVLLGRALQGQMHKNPLEAQ